jgi:hypothetical protein
MSYISLKHKLVKIRKDRRCFGCSDLSLAGSKMVYNVGLSDGDFNSYYMCPCCDAYVSTMNAGDIFYEGDFRGEPHYLRFKKKFYE